MSNFVHLHVHSDYSLADASVSTASLVKRAKELEMTHIALTDHGNMFGTMEFVAACEKQKNAVKPIVGCEVYVSPSSRFIKSGAEHENRYYHLILLAADKQGYHNLVRLSSLAYTEGFYYRPRIDEELLEKYHDGLIALSGCLSGEIPRLIQAGKNEEAEKKALYYKELFGKDENGEPCFYLEIQRHGITADVFNDSDFSQEDINKRLIEISRKTGVPLVATNDVHYLDREDYIAHDILLCIGTGKKRTDEKRKKYFGDQFYLKTAQEMYELFSDYPEAIENTVKIASRCNAEVPNVSIKDLPKYLPDYEIPPGFENADTYLRYLINEGLKVRYPKEFLANGAELEIIKKRADFEIDTIVNMGFTGYFLIVWDFIKYAREHDIPVGPGRGSGAGSIAAYSLQITDIDPIKYGLLFERFLNPERISMPDFDIDFPNYARDKVRNYVIEKYGKERVGKIITFSTLKTKQVLKDVARTLGIGIPESDMILKLIPAPKGQDPVTLKSAFDDEPRLRELENDPRYTELFQLARKLEGLNRNSSIHAAGVVIGKQALIDLVPLYKERDDPKTGKDGAISTQYSMNYLESSGLLKMDFLGLQTLDVIRHAEDLIKLRGGEYSNFDVKKVPENDKAAFKMLGEGNSFGIFQFESDGMQDILKQTKPDSIDDLTALNAMYRPGPMQNIPRFVDSKNGKTPITYPDPSLEGILKETYGVIVYQEQVMEVARIIAGYSIGKADLLRRAMGKKKKEILDEEKIPFLEGAAKNGYSAAKAGAIYDMLIPFAGYGFNKSHAAGYSVIAYHTAYIKANFPLEFFAANLTNDIDSADKNRLSRCIDEARRMGIPVDPPNINRSGKLFSVVEGRIVYGLLGIKGLGDASAEEIIRGRKEEPYKSFTDFLNKVDIKTVGKKVIELLILTGAFDNFGVSRETLEGNLEKAVEYALKNKEDKVLGQSGLFDDVDDERDIQEFKFEEFPLRSRTDKLNIEKQLIGFYFSGHPMDEYKDIWETAVNANLGDTDNLKTGNCILIGIIKNIKSIITNKGSKMAFASLSDYNGEIEVTFFSGPWERCQHLIKNDSVAILKGKIDYQRDKDKYSFLADSIISKEEVSYVAKEVKEMEEKNKAHKNTWAYMADLKSSFILKAKKGSYTIIGFLKQIREIKDRNGNDMAFGTIQDFEGEIDIVFFSKIYAECRHLLNIDEIIALKGSIDPENERNQEKISFKVTSIADYAQLSRSAVKKAAANEKPDDFEPIKKDDNTVNEIHIKLKKEFVNDNNELNKLRDYLAENSGSCTIYIYVPVDGGEKKIKAMSGLDSSRTEVIDGISNCDCVAEVWRK
ncbi:MAG: DNA polymerase III subunit alpha [Treponema sp.]|nr:DNA polymerase III subunit alpha [Treponema sp.]